MFRPNGQQHSLELNPIHGSFDLNQHVDRPAPGNSGHNPSINLAAALPSKVHALAPGVAVGLDHDPEKPVHTAGQQPFGGASQNSAAVSQNQDSAVNPQPSAVNLQPSVATPSVSANSGLDSSVVGSALEDTISSVRLRPSEVRTANPPVIISHRPLHTHASELAYPCFAVSAAGHDQAYGIDVRHSKIYEEQPTITQANAFAGGHAPEGHVDGNAQKSLDLQTLKPFGQPGQSVQSGPQAPDALSSQALGTTNQVLQSGQYLGAAQINQTMNSQKAAPNNAYFNPLTTASAALSSHEANKSYTQGSESDLDGRTVNAAHSDISQGPGTAPDSLVPRPSSNDPRLQTNIPAESSQILPDLKQGSSQLQGSMPNRNLPSSALTSSDATVRDQQRGRAVDGQAALNAQSQQDVPRYDQPSLHTMEVRSVTRPVSKPATLYAHACEFAYPSFTVDVIHEHAKLGAARPVPS